MQRHARNAFTLIELLIVVVILGILAAIVVPQFSNASDSAVKSALKSQLQTISSQLELYRVQHQGSYPTLGGEGATNDGWDVMVTEGYLKETPFNGYVSMSNLVVGDSTVMATAKASATSGWATDNAGGIWAVGFDPTPTAEYPDGEFSSEQSEN